MKPTYFYYILNIEKYNTFSYNYEVVFGYSKVFTEIIDSLFIVIRFFMHEMSIAQNIIDIVHDNLPRESKEKVTKIHLKVGELAGVISDSLIFCFDILKDNQSLKNASLEIETIPITGKCISCNQISKLEYGVFFCPNCQSNNIEIITGKELSIIDIELED